MQWPTFACQIAHCPAWLTVGTSPCAVALGGSRGHARAEERAGGRAAFLAAKGPGCQAGLCQPVPPTLDTSLELICLAVGSVCKLHRPFAAPLRPLAWPSKGSRATADWQAVSSAAHGCHTIRSSQLKDKATHTRTPTKEVTEEHPWVTQRSRSGQKRERRILDGSKSDCSCDGQISWPQTQTWLLIRARIYIYAFVCNICQRMPRPVDWSEPRPRLSTVHFCFSNANGATAKLI